MHGVRTQELKPSTPLEDIVTDYQVESGPYQHDVASLLCFLAHRMTASSR